jgi:uncharacterized membrane protein YqaE (UPF0057 family)
MLFLINKTKILEFNVNDPGNNGIRLLNEITRTGLIPFGARIQINGRHTSPKRDDWFQELQEQQRSAPSKNHLVQVEWFYPLKGGFIIETIEAVIGIFQFLLYIPKAAIWIGRLITWFIKTITYLIALVSQVLSKEGILGLIRFVSMEIIMAPFILAGTFLSRAVNSLGQQTVGGWLTGADNAPDDNDKGGLASPVLDPDRVIDPADSDNLPSDPACPNGSGRKCYKTQAGTVPTPVIIATVLFPPAGVFMELGLHGFIQILVCLLLTFMFYFPGLIYALIVLYC